MPECLTIGCQRDELGIKSGTRHEICRAVHAEQNALIQAGKAAKGSTLYINAYPCKICAKMIINAQVKRVVVTGSYPDEDGIKLLTEAGIGLLIYSDPPEEI
jgi:dCMP deaminase